jgi:hypothetical protein
MANDILFANNASALLAATINSTDTTVQVASGFGALFPSPSGGSYFYLTLEDDNGDVEIVKCTARTGDNLTVERGQEGTTAQGFSLTVTRCELRLTADTMEEFLQKNGGAMTGNLDMNTNEIQDAVLTGSSTSIQAGEIVAVPIRGATGETGNQIVVPANGVSKPTVGGVEVLLANDDLMALLDTTGVIIFDSATTGCRIIDGAYLRVEGSASNYASLAHDDTDFSITGTNTTDLNVTGFTNLVLDSVDLSMGGNQIIEPDLIDFSVTRQTVAGASTTEISYAAGSYVNLTLGTNIGTLNLTNPPAAGKVGTLRLKITSTGTREITWPASVRWPNNGQEPTLTTDGIDFIDLWTDDGGTTWYGAYNTNWS